LPELSKHRVLLRRETRAAGRAGGPLHDLRTEMLEIGEIQGDPGGAPAETCFGIGAVIRCMLSKSGASGYSWTI
jgi:hypothetical protein